MVNNAHITCQSTFYHPAAYIAHAYNAQSFAGKVNAKTKALALAPFAACNMLPAACYFARTVNYKPVSQICHGRRKHARSIANTYAAGIAFRNVNIIVTHGSLRDYF